MAAPRVSAVLFAIAMLRSIQACVEAIKKQVLGNILFCPVGNTEFLFSLCPEQAGKVVDPDKEFHFWPYFLEG